MTDSPSSSPVSETPEPDTDAILDELGSLGFRYITLGHHPSLGDECWHASGHRDATPDEIADAFAHKHEGEPPTWTVGMEGWAATRSGALTAALAHARSLARSAGGA